MSAATKYTTVVLLALLACCAIVVLALVSNGAGRECFPASSWGPAPESTRPCVEVVRVEEDGSFRYRVSDADSTVRYSSGIGALDR